MSDEHHVNPFGQLFEQLISSCVIRRDQEQGKYARQRLQLQQEVFEDSFITWLKRDSPHMQYAEFIQRCTVENLTAFAQGLSTLEYAALRERKEQLFKERWDRGDYVGGFHLHQYNVDAVDNYWKLKNLIDNNPMRTGIVDKELYLQSLELDIENLCAERDMPYPATLNNHIPLVVTSEDNRYFLQLAKKLMTYDPIKIPAVLDWHNALYTGKTLFASAVEFAVYDHVRFACPVENTECLKIIMNWVDKNRVFLPPDAPQSSTAAPVYNLNWNGYNLSKLSKFLHSKKCMEKPTDFERMFTDQQRRKWIGDFDYLAHLLYMLRYATVTKEKKKVKVISTSIDGQKTGRFWVVVSQFLCDDSLSSHDNRKLSERGSRIFKHPSKHADTVAFVKEALSRIEIDYATVVRR